MPRKINVFSAEVVVWAGEQFEWVMTGAEGTTVTVQQGSTPWPLTQTSYTVTPAQPVAASVSANTEGQSAVFQTNPAAPNVSEQTVSAAAWVGDVCGSPDIDSGQFLIWQNSNASNIVIKPNSGNPNYWPLPGDEYLVPKNGFLVVDVPPGTTDGEYPLSVTEQGSTTSPCGKMGTQPKIVVGSGFPKARR